MKQDKIDLPNGQSDSELKPLSIQDNLTLSLNKLTINLRETEEQELISTFQRRPQYRINENSRRRFD